MKNLEKTKSARDVARLSNGIINLKNLLKEASQTKDELKQELQASDEKYRELESRVKSSDDLINFSDEENRELRAINSMSLFEADTPIDTLIESGEIEAEVWRERAKKYGIATVKGQAFLDAAYRLEFQLDYFRNLKGEIPVTMEARKLLQETIDESDLARYTRFKRWARENLVGLSAIAITIGGIITSVVIGLKKGVTTVATAAWSLGKAFAHIAATAGPIIGSLFSFIGTVLSLGSKGIFFLANNLWLLGSLILSALYARRKIKK